MSDIQVGDKVRVTIEDEVVETGRDGQTIFLKNESGGRLWFDLDVDNCTVEVIGKAIVTFKPGDVVRSIQYPKYKYTVAAGGYLTHQYGFEYHKSGPPFTSEHYELVTLHESPL